MKKSLLHTISILPHKLIFVLFVLLIVNCSLLIVNCYGQWYKQPIPVNQQITGIKFVDTSNGWACTTKFNATQQDTAFILHTTNGGTNWFIQYFRPSIQAYDAMTMVNNMIGYAAGDSIQGQFGGGSILIKTTNGGLNWFNIPIPYNMSITKFYFFSPDTGWETDSYASSPDARLTTDGGFTWQQRTNGMTDYPTRCAFFLNYNTGYCGSGHSLYKTTNAGISWQLNIAFSNAISSIFFLNENTGWAGQAGYFIEHTSNGGSNWISQSLPPLAQSDTYVILFFDSLKGYAGDGINAIFKTNNGGLNWGYQIDTGGQKNISFVDSLHGWTTPMYSGFVEHTTNGGGSISYVGIINISNEIPEEYKLFQNFPNPFNPSTKIEIDVPQRSLINIAVYDVTGREVVTLINEELAAGKFSVTWDASNYPSGLYFCRLTSDKFTETRKMILLK